jgi:hypothetical protein
MQRSYKTARVARVLDGLDGKRIQAGPAVSELVALVGFGFVGSVSPGPNKAVLWASGCGWGSAERSHRSWARPWGRPASAHRGGQRRDAPAGEVVVKVVGLVPLVSGLSGRGVGMEDSPQEVSRCPLKGRTLVQRMNTRSILGSGPRT